MNTSPLWVVLLLCGISAALPNAIPAAEAGGEGAEAARNALRDGTDFPWYDPQTDQIRAISLPPEKPLRRASDWEWDTNTSSSAPTRRGSWQTVWQWVQYGVWLALAILLTVLAYLWMKAIGRHETQPKGAAWDEEEERRHESDSIEQLPFQVKRPQTDLLGQARRHYEAQEYRDAIIYLFSHQLVQLDRHQQIQLAKGKTNRQYLHEIASTTRLRQLLMQTMLTFEDVFFGNYELDRERFEVCWNHLNEFEQLVKSTSAGST